MIFNSAREMLDYIQEGNDLYNPNDESYVFLYNGYGSIAEYGISKEHAKELAKQAKENDEYWGAFLGPHGYIFDDPSCDFFEEGDTSNLDWCEDHYQLEGWMNTEEVEP